MSDRLRNPHERPLQVFLCHSSNDKPRVRDLWSRLKTSQVKCLNALSPDVRFDKTNESRKTLAQIIGGILVLANLFPPGSDLNNSGVEFVLNDLDVALTLMDVADASSIQETILRNHKNAHIAYDSVLRLLRNLTPDVLQQHTIDGNLAILKKRLLALGQQF